MCIYIYSADVNYMEENLIIFLHGLGVLSNSGSSHYG